MLFLLISIILYGFANGHTAKSSLTFVIDDTDSMKNDIAQVKEKTNEVFDAVLNSNASKIDDFIIVTFNDPDAKLYTKTRDRQVFKNALSDIRVHGGGDCPEYSMKGIELALEHSKPNSLFYVFTDASSKDYTEYERIKSLGLKKSIQVTFLLTGECYGGPEEAFTVYDKLAESTSGQVFHLDKQDVRKVINYIIETIKSKKTTIAHKKFSNGYGNSFQFTIDSKLWDVMISVSADAPEYHLTGPDGNLIEVKNFIDTDKSSISKLDFEPGIYTIFMETIGYTSVSVTGSTSVSFEHGFSTVKPNTLKETSTKPIKDIQSYLAIELDNVNRDIILDTVEIRDMDDNFISAYPVELLDKDKQFYVTKPILTPDFTFKIAINGHTNTKEKITRIAPTAIEHQKPDLEGPSPKAPTVTILEGDKTTVEYDSNLLLKCKVNAFPKPDIVWKDDSGMIWPSKVIPVDLPYEYLGILNKEKVNRNITWYCTAKNVVGEDKKSISVETKKNYFLEILERPKDLVIEYGSTSVLNFKVNAYPPAKITWFNKREMILKTDDNFEVAPDGSRVAIKHMHQGLRGLYTVQAVNEKEKKIISFKIDMSGEIPEIDKKLSSFTIDKGSIAELNCRIVKGKPEPTISWTFQSATSGSLKHLDVNGDLYIDKVGPENMGIYTCKAANEFGMDRHDMELFVVYGPTIEDNHNSEVVLPQGKQVILPCRVDGSPYPFVRWLKSNVEIPRTGKYLFNDNTLSFTSTIDDRGVYTCEATNIVGKAEKHYDVKIFIPIKMEVPRDTTLKLDVGSSVTLPCHYDGYPKPKVRWTFYSKRPHVRPKMLQSDDSGAYNLEHVQDEDEFFYRCSASNLGGSKSITYNVQVRAPVSITNPDGVVFNAIKGDLALRIPCNAIGSPKPKVTWKANDEYIASGTSWYDIEEDGTLIIKNVTLNSDGNYICHARNYFSADTKEFTVNVKASPELDIVRRTMSIKLGSSGYIDCDLPHKNGDIVSWYKDGELIPSNRLYLRNVTYEDAGIYSCRVSTFFSAHTSHKKVTVGYNPRFVSDEETNIEYSEGEISYMNCEADGDPQPNTQWSHNGDPIPTNEPSIVIEMKPDGIGDYQCIVQNKFGSISRTFKIDSGDCLLHIDDDFNAQQPLLLTLLRDWPELRTSNNYVHVPKYKYFILSCPGSSVIYNGESFGDNVKTKCSETLNFEIKDRTIDFYELKCAKVIKPLAKRTGTSCFAGNTELLQVGFSLRNKFLEVYDVCLDYEHKIPLFANHTLHKHTAINALPNNYQFLKSRFLAFNFEDMYECRSQLSFISSVTGKSIQPGLDDDECCFTKRQLINPQDVLPGLSQKAVYSYLNVIPHWSTCGTKNWVELEVRIRYLAKNSYNKLSVFTGGSHPMTLPGQTKRANVSLVDTHKRRQPVPMYLWKVVQNLADKSSLAVIQLNIPKVTYDQAYSFMPCKDICSEIEWLGNNDWQDVSKGFTVCCSITDFNLHFGKLFKGYEKEFKTLPPIVTDFSFI